MPRLHDLIEQLRRRHVFKVAAAYAVVGWLVIEVSATVAPHLLLPEWVPRAIIVVVLLGFPVALVLAWAYDITPEGIRPTGPTTAESSEADHEAGSRPPPEGKRTGVSSASGRLPAWVGPGGLLLAVGLALGSFLYRGSIGVSIPTGDEPAAEVAALADQDRTLEGFEMVRAAIDQGEPIAPALQARVADRMTVLSEPSGARIRARRFTPEQLQDGTPEEWRDLGTTPVFGLMVPRGDYLLQIEREGYETVERLASTELQRTGPPSGQVPESVIRVRLPAEGTIPDGMVFVSGGPYSVVSPNLQGLLANLGDFLLDRFEVTNADFGRFIDAGGYREDAHWTALFADPEVQDPAQMRAGFVDRTGLPGPRSWTGQNPPGGRELHPVTDVTWYEAAAYCAFRERRLPTFFEWEKGARGGTTSAYTTVQLPWGPVTSGQTPRLRANFSSEGTSIVGAHPLGISPYGAYDMAGNVKEWLRNPAETGRAVTGGSWEDPVYLFSAVGSLAPLSTSSSLGFRCARRAPGSGAGTSSQGDGPLRLTVETPKYEPVGDEAFSGLVSHYAYDPVPVAGEVVERREAGGWIRERILVDGPGEDPMIAYLYLPTTSRPPYQTLAFVPGSGTFKGVSVPAATEWLLAPVIRSGRAVLVVVMEGMTERPFPAGFQPPDRSSVRFRDLMVRRATELRMGIDYLGSRDDIDLGSLGYVGLSWGAGSGLLFAAVDDRFRAVILVGGGIGEGMHPTLPEASSINFAPRIGAPVLFLNGREDEISTWLTRALPLWNLLPEPKELVLVEGAGHVPAPPDRVPPMLDFLDRTLGPVPR